MVVYKRGDVVTLKSGGQPMTVGAYRPVSADGTYNNVLLYWHDHGGVMQEFQLDAEMIQPHAPVTSFGVIPMEVDGNFGELASSERKVTEMALENLHEHHLLGFGIPQEIIEQAKRCGVDFMTLVKMCITDSVSAAKRALDLLESKLGRK